MKRMDRKPAFRWLGALCLVLVSFGGPSVRAEGQEGAPESPKAVAEVDGEKITAEELDRALAAVIYRVEQQVFQVRSEKLEELIADRLISKEAAKREVSVDELTEQEIATKTEKVSDEEVNTVYQQYKARLTGTEEEGKKQVRTYLEGQKAQQARERFVGSLRAQAKVVVYLEEPQPPLVGDVHLEGAPVRGPEGATVTLVEFVDYQ